MKFTILFFVSLFVVADSMAQISIADSTVQVISYWDKGEKQVYAISLEKIKIKNSDTTSKELMTYDVEVTVLDSTSNSYTIQWIYKNINSDDLDALSQRLAKASENMKVIFKTDEFGAFKEVVNWKEIRDQIRVLYSGIQKDFKHIPEIEKMLKQLESVYSSKEAIESVAIKDVHQFHTFHGGKYDYHEVVEGNVKMPNVYGPEPFDSKFTVFLDEINTEDNNYILRSAQEVNREQLTKAVMSYLASLAETMKVDPPKTSDIGDIKNEILGASRIHGTGWVVYSIQTTAITIDNATNIEERIIEIK